MVVGLGGGVQGGREFLVPAACTRCGFKGRILDTLPEPLRGSVRTRERLFSVKLRKPSVLFCCGTLGGSPIGRRKRALRRRFTSRFFRRTIRIVRGTGSPTITHTCVCKFVYRFTLSDRYRPCIRGVVRIKEISRGRVRVRLSQVVLARSCRSPLHCLATGRVRPGVRCTRIVTPFFGSMATRRVCGTLGKVIFCRGLFLTPASKGQGTLFLKVGTIKGCSSLRSVIVDMGPSPLYRGCYGILGQRCSNTIPLTTDLVMRCRGGLFRSAPLPRHFRRAFNTKRR